MGRFGKAFGMARSIQSTDSNMHPTEDAISPSPDISRTHARERQSTLHQCYPSHTPFDQQLQSISTCANLFTYVSHLFPRAIHDLPSSKALTPRASAEALNAYAMNPTLSRISSDPSSSPCSKPPQSLARTPAMSRCMRRLPRGLEAESWNRRRDRQWWPST